ncbi:MAG: hypothetical protein ACKN9F_07445 [Methylomonas sp.]
MSILRGLLAGVVLASNLCLADSGVLPDSVKTPGEVMTTDANLICRPGYSKSVRHVPESVKRLAYESYGITSRQPGEYEVDHLISLELGGSNSIKNLWPESFVTQPLNAHVKDELENKLHDLICSNQLPVAQAQREIASNWIQAYEKYIGPLPDGSQRKFQRALPAPKPLPLLGLMSGEKAPLAKGACPDSAPIKVSKNGIYHLINDANYDRTKAKHCFDSAAAAELAGFRAPK